MGSRARIIGHLLLWCGFLYGAYIAVEHVERSEDPWSTIRWGHFASSIAVGTVGVVLLRLTFRKGATADGEERSVEELASLLSHIDARLQEWIAGWKEQAVYLIHERIDDELAASLLQFAASRHAMEHAWGLRAYAEVMNEFAQGERLINRAWSASADGYADEVLASLRRSQRHFSAAAAMMRRR